MGGRLIMCYRHVREGGKNHIEYEKNHLVRFPRSLIIRPIKGKNSIMLMVVVEGQH